MLEAPILALQARWSDVLTKDKRNITAHQPNRGVASCRIEGEA